MGDPLTLALALVQAVHLWAWVLMFLALAARHLRKPGPRIAYLSAVVYPFYVAHQVPIVAGLFFLRDSALPWPAKFVLLCGASFAFGLLFYEAMRRTRPTRFLFGIRERPRPQAPEAAAPPPPPTSG